jgi:DNA-binding NarL/FixJ family response regulator
MIKVVIADDHKIFRDGLKLLFKREKDYELLGEAANGLELVELVESNRPDIILTDIKMPIMDGIAAVKHILGKYPEALVIALSMFDEESLVQEMLEAGAMGYLLKDAQKEEIIEAIELVRSGRQCYSRTFSPKLIRLLASSNYNPFKQRKSIDLTEKEIQIIECMCHELTSKEIADKLELSTRTVEWYRVRIMEKIEAKSATGIIIYAIKHNLVKI